ncbi:MAG: fibronectin type III domain-containing protein [Saprospiraceae bacterium]|nr:fibronectin type III domain-containing protein [Saprospiraceae bacterium]
MKNLLSVFAFLLTMLFASANPQSPETSCPAPSNVQVTGAGTGYISFDWDNCNCFSTGFTVSFLRHADGYTSPETTVTNSNHTFNGLQAGTYTFYFRTKCGSGASEIIGHEDVMIG